MAIPSGNAVLDAKDNAIEKLQEKIKELEDNSESIKIDLINANTTIAFLQDNSEKYEKMMVASLDVMELNYLREFKLRVEAENGRK